MNIDLKKSIDFWVGNLLLLCLKPMARLLGKVLRRDHSPLANGEIAILKLLGGGSLVIGLPALLAIRKRYPNSKLIMVTTPAIKPFAQTLGIFDEYVVVNDQGFLNLALSSLKALWRLFKIDTIIDLEVHSRLSTIFCLFTCARNRIGFYREDVRDRLYFATHTIFFNLFFGAWYFYEEIAKLLGATIPSSEEVRDHFLTFNKLQVPKENSSPIRVGIGHGCSDLSPERMLDPEHWLQHFNRHIDSNKSYEVFFLGGPKEKEIGERIIEILKPHFPNVTYENTCGKLKLNDSIQKLSEMNEFWGIDSALLHYARLLGIKTKAYFGPTMPLSLIKPLPYLDEEIIYNQVPCSPCVHITEIPPCHGDNICIKNLFNS
jgi:ADP-heptose:LPS heptosyltransferase